LFSPPLPFPTQSPPLFTAFRPKNDTQHTTGHLDPHDCEVHPIQPVVQARPSSLRGFRPATATVAAVCALWPCQRTRLRHHRVRPLARAACTQAFFQARLRFERDSRARQPRQGGSVQHKTASCVVVPLYLVIK